MNYKVMLIISVVCAINFLSLGMEVKSNQQVIEAANLELLYAVKENRVDDVKRLIADGIADVTIKDEFGVSLLGYDQLSQNHKLMKIVFDAMVNAKRNPLQLESKRYNRNECLFARLPNDSLLDIFSYCFSKDKDQVKGLKNTLKTCIKLRNTCMKFNSLLTIEVIANFVKKYNQEYKDRVLNHSLTHLLPVLILIHSGADASKTTLLESATYSFSMFQYSKQEKQAWFEIVEASVKNGATQKQKDDALLLAVKQRLYKIVILLIKAGANVNTCNKYNSTPLMLVSEYTYDDCIATAKALIEAGADVNMTSVGGFNALIGAIGYENTELIDILTNAGAHLNTQDANQRTPLMRACGAGSFCLVKDFIRAGVDVNMVDQDGNTAFIYAVERKELRRIKALIEAGVDVTIRNNDGESALSVALTDCYPDIETRMTIINPRLKYFERKNIETILMINKNANSCLSELPQRVLKIIITCAYPECAIDHQTMSNLHSQVLVDTVPLETLAALIKNGILQQESILGAWREKLMNITQELKPSKKLGIWEIVRFENETLKNIEKLLCGNVKNT